MKGILFVIIIPSVFIGIKQLQAQTENSDCILYDPFSKKVFTFNGRSSNATVLDANSLQVLATIPTAGKPEFSQSDGTGKIYVNIAGQTARQRNCKTYDFVHVKNQAEKILS